MSLVIPKTCSMGGTQTGLVGTIGITLYNPDGSVHTARATAGIYEIGTNTGCYGKDIAFPDNWKGSILWDTGGGSPAYATEDYDIEGMIDMIEEDTSKMNFTGTDIKATLDGEKVALSDATEGEIDRILTATEIKQAAINDAAATTTKFTTNLTETSNDFWNRMAVLFTSGNNIGQMRRIKDYKGATKEITVQTPLDVAPADADTFIIPSARAFLTVDIADIVDANWDEILTGATHNIATSAGKRLRQIGAYNIHDGTALAGSCYSITLAATASSSDHIYNRNLVVIVGGTGIGQTRTIADYDGTSQIAVVDRDWWINPDATSEYYILSDDTPLVVDHGIAQAGASESITFRSSASAIDETYTGGVVAIIASTGEGQSRLITAYNGTTKVAAITPAWITNPTSSSIYVVMPYGCSCVGNLTDPALTQISDKLSTVHGTNSWETATGFAKPSDVKVTCGGGGGGAIIERPAIWKPEEKLKLIEDIKKMYKMITELSSLQSVGLQNVKNNIEGLKNSLLKLIKEEVALLISLKVIVSGQPKTDNSAMLADSINQIIAKWGSIQKSILKPSDLSSLDNKLDDITKIVAKSLSNKDLEELINEE